MQNDLVIGDLGHAKILDETASKQTNSNRKFGTENYLAPEANNPIKRSVKLDIWSLGCIVYELFILEKLFNHRNPDKLRQSILNFNIDTQLIKDNEKINSLFVKILKK